MTYLKNAITMSSALDDAVSDDDDVRDFAALQAVGDGDVAGADGGGDGDNGFAGKAFKLRDQSFVGGGERAGGHDSEFVVLGCHFEVLD